MTARIAVIGAGPVGVGLTRAWLLGAKRQVVLGLRRDRPDLADLPTATVGRSLRDSDVIVLTVPGRELASFVREHGRLLDGRVIVDATNNLVAAPATSDVGDRRLHQRELFEEHAPGADWFRAFNSIGWENFIGPSASGEFSDLLYCGPDNRHRPLVESLIEVLGLRPIWLGGPDEADLLDAMTKIWFSLAFARGHGRRLGLRFLDGEAPGRATDPSLSGKEATERA